MPPLKPLANAWNQRTLSRGLQVVLSYDEDRWRLALRRENVPPSEDEIEICMQAWEVPESAHRTMSTASARHPLTDRIVKYHTVELTWLEYEHRTIQPTAQAG